MDWSIQQVARLAGTTSRTLRHYDSLGLLPPSRIGANGYRYYDRASLTRLQRILLLRELGLGLPAIAEILAGHQQDAVALAHHLDWLAAEQDRIGRQMASIRATIHALTTGGTLMAQDMFDGFDNSQYREEVEQRWGAQAYARSDAWWRGLGRPGQQDFMAEHAAIAEAWAQAREAGLASDDPRVAAIAARHVAWIRAGWGGVPPTPEAITGLAEMYVADERFAANYGGTEGAMYVRDGLVAYANLP